MTDTTKLDQQPGLNIRFMLDGTEDSFVQPYLANDNNDAPVQISRLSDSESEELAELEKDIDEAMEHFNDIGFRLYQIKAKKLYRGTHTTFAAYCLDKFQISRVHGDRLVKAFKTQEILKREPDGSVAVPKTEAALRGLGGLAPENVKKVGKQLKDDGCENPTANDVNKAKAKAVPANTSKNPVKVSKPESLKLVLKDIDETVTMVEQDRPKGDIIASLHKASEIIKTLLKKKGTV
jgi:hypothetical protein